MRRWLLQDVDVMRLQPATDMAPASRCTSPCYLLLQLMLHSHTVFSICWTKAFIIYCMLCSVLYTLKIRMKIQWRHEGGCHTGRQLRVSPIFFFKKTGEFFCSSLSLLLISLRCHPLEGVTPHLFTCPTSFVHYSLSICPQFFSFGRHLLKGVTRGGPLPRPSS